MSVVGNFQGDAWFNLCSSSWCYGWGWVGHCDISNNL